MTLDDARAEADAIIEASVALLRRRIELDMLVTAPLARPPQLAAREEEAGSDWRPCTLDEVLMAERARLQQWKRAALNALAENQVEAVGRVH